MSTPRFGTFLGLAGSKEKNASLYSACDTHRTSAMLLWGNCRMVRGLLGVHNRGKEYSLPQLIGWPETA